MPNIPSDGAVVAFYENCAYEDGSEALGEFEMTLRELSKGAHSIVPVDIDTVEAAWLWPDIGWSTARFVVRLTSGRRVCILSCVWPPEGEVDAGDDTNTLPTAFTVDLKIERLASGVERPPMGEDGEPGDWLDDVEALNEFLALWKGGRRPLH